MQNFKILYLKLFNYVLNFIYLRLASREEYATNYHNINDNVTFLL